MNRAIISIIIPTPHQSKLIQQTLNSLRAQTFQEWEALVVDDGSHDEIPEKMLSMSREYGRIKYIKRTRQNSGAPACRNEGTYFSQGKYLIYLWNADTGADDIDRFLTLDIPWQTTSPMAHGCMDL